MAKVKSYMNPNIPKPKPRGDTEVETRRITKPMEPRITPVGPIEDRRKNRPGPLTPRTPGKPGKREKRPLPNPRTPGGPGKREKRPLPKPITKPFDLRKEKQAPRKFASVISKRKPAASQAPKRVTSRGGK